MVVDGRRFLSVSECQRTTGLLAGAQGGAGGPVPPAARRQPATQTAYSQAG